MNKNFRIDRLDYQSTDYIDTLVKMCTSDRLPKPIIRDLVIEATKFGKGGVCLLDHDTTLATAGPNQIVGILLAQMSTNPPLTTIKYIWVSPSDYKDDREEALFEEVYKLSKKRRRKIFDIIAEYSEVTAPYFERNGFFLHDNQYRLSLREQ